MARTKPTRTPLPIGAFAPSTINAEINAETTARSVENAALTVAEEVNAEADENRSLTAVSVPPAVAERTSVASISNNPVLTGNASSATVTSSPTLRNDTAAENALSTTAPTQQTHKMIGIQPYESLSKYLLSPTLLSSLAWLHENTPGPDPLPSPAPFPPQYYHGFIDQICIAWYQAVRTILEILDARTKCGSCKAKGAKCEMDADTQRLRLILGQRLDMMDPMALHDKALRDEIAELLERVERTYWINHAKEWLAAMTGVEDAGCEKGLFVSVYPQQGHALIGVKQGEKEVDGEDGEGTKDSAGSVMENVNVAVAANAGQGATMTAKSKKRGQEQSAEPGPSSKRRKRATPSGKKGTNGPK